MALNRYFGKLETQDEENKELQLQVESCEVKEVTSEVMINGSSPSDKGIDNRARQLSTPEAR
jgi:hypothetical protein